MPSINWQANTASSSTWLSPNNGRVPSDGLFALQRVGDTQSSLILTRPGGGVVGASDTILGVQLSLLALMGAEGRGLMTGEMASQNVDGPADPASEYQAVEVALTLNGATPASSWRTLLVGWLWQWRQNNSYDTPPALTSGSASDLWGLALAPSDVNSSGFGVLVRRKASHAGQTPGDVFVDAATLLITTAESGGGGGGGGGGSTRMAETIRQFSLLAPETTPGTPVLAGMRKPTSFAINLNQRSNKGSNRPAGQKVASHKPTMREWTEGSIVDTGVGVNYDELYWLLAGITQIPTTAQLAAGVQRHSGSLRKLQKDNWRYYTVAEGDLDTPSDFRTSAGVFLTELGLSFGKEAISLSGSVIGRQLSAIQAAPTGVNEVQTLTLGATITAGTMVLSVNGLLTASIAGSATPATFATNIQNALNTLLGANSVTVATTSATVYTITFTGNGFQGLPAPVVSVHNNSLTSATTVTIALTTPGGYAELAAVEPILPAHWEVWISDTVGGLGQEPQRLTKAFLGELQITRGRTPEYFAGRAIGSTFGDVAEEEDAITLNLAAESSSNIKRLIADSRADARLYVRLEAVGGQIGATGINRSLRFDMACKVSEDGGFGDNDGVHDLSRTLEVVWDNALGGSLLWQLVNPVAANGY